MKNANDIIKRLEEYITFKDFADMEEVKLYFYVLYKWAQDRDYNIFFVIRDVKRSEKLNGISILIYFKTTKGIIFDMKKDDTMSIEIEIVGQIDSFKKELHSALTLFFNRMKELDERNDGLEDFLGGDIENEFF